MKSKQEINKPIKLVTCPTNLRGIAWTGISKTKSWRNSNSHDQNSIQRTKQIERKKKKVNVVSFGVEANTYL